MASKTLALLVAVAPGALALKCPGSTSWVHASAQVEAMANATCKEVMEEIKARVTGDWQLGQPFQKENHNPRKNCFGGQLDGLLCRVFPQQHNLLWGL